jgi:hypothetical protein
VGDWDTLERLHLFQRPKRITEARHGISERVASLVARMLEKQPQDRFQSWTEVADEIAAIAADSLPGAAIGGDDSLVRVAAQQVERVRSHALEQERLAPEQGRKQRERQDLLAYWANEFFDAVERRIVRVNQGLGQRMIKVERRSMVTTNRVPDDGVGGKYEVLGRERIVLALNLQALMYQRARQHIMSHVQYSERSLEADALFSQLLQILVEDATT